MGIWRTQNIFIIMALINCSECGTQMSEKAQSCPKCGAPNPNVAPVYQQSFNPCARHPQAPAVTTCGNCGSAMCGDCKDLAIYSMDNKPMCIDCNLSYMQSNISHLKSAKRWSSVKFIVLLIIVLIAVVIWQDKPKDFNHIFMAWIIAAVGGIFSTMSMVKRSASEKAVDDLYTKMNPEDGLMNEGMGCVTRIIVALFFAPLYTIGYTIKHLFRWISSSRGLSKAEKEYKEYTSVLRERGEM